MKTLNNTIIITLFFLVAAMLFGLSASAEETSFKLLYTGNMVGTVKPANL